MDWTEALGNLRDSLPDGDDAPETVSESQKNSSEETLHIQFERKGRAGKSATIVYGFTTSTDEEISALASRLKQSLGCGGSARGGEILLQGDRSTALRPLLTSLGYKVK
ncbi:MAG: translation initiation factor [Muribaculaceae bacterium]|nr:translation initiation factor [Muribaculaceae bacterium]